MHDEQQGLDELKKTILEVAAPGLLLCPCPGTDARLHYQPAGEAEDERGEEVAQGQAPGAPGPSHSIPGCPTNSTLSSGLPAPTQEQLIMGGGKASDIQMKVAEEKK